MMTIGDLAQSLVMRANQTRLKSDAQNLATQVTTGLTTDIPRHLSGNMTLLSSIERGVTKLETYAMANLEAQTMSRAMQTVLGSVQTQTQDLASDFLKADLSSPAASREILSFTAGQVFESIVAGLNSQHAGRALFGGDATDRAAFVDSRTMVDRVKEELAGATTYEAINERLEMWFESPDGPFSGLAYIGGTSDVEPIRLNDSETVQLNIRADQPVFRSLLKATLMGQMASDGDFNLSATEQAVMFREAGNALLSLQSDVTKVRADLGTREERIQNVIERNQSEKSALEIARSSLISSDQYQAATELSDIQHQLESLYALTARASQLSLVGYLR